MKRIMLFQHRQQEKQRSIIKKPETAPTKTKKETQVAFLDYQLQFSVLGFMPQDTPIAAPPTNIAKPVL